LKDRLDSIAKKLDRRDEPARQLAKELMQMTHESDSAAPVSRRNAELIKILWQIDSSFWTTDGGGTLFNTQLSDQPSIGDVPVSMKILSSLGFSNMEAREEAIPEAYTATFKWIFHEKNTNDGEGETVPLNWPSFPGWLQDSTDHVYWITGKPGSGKSTLMKYIFENPRLQPFLRSYAGDLPLMLAGFFFWNPGSEMQKSYEGLLRTLLYQCLVVRQDLIPAIAPRRWALYNLLGADGAEAVVPDWTWRELKESFEALCSYHGRQFRLAFFIDGLDEFEGAEKSSAILINWIKDTIARFGIKFCISSRPWNVFSDAFGKHNSLMMQDLTRNDIDYFVRTEFDKSGAFQELKDVFHDDAKQLISNIIEKAEGVFLWVSLVVKSLLATLTDTPSLALLNEKLAEIPSDIVGMYNAIWNSVAAERLGTASKIFQLCMLQEFTITGETFWLACEGPAVRAQTVLDQSTRQGITKILRRMLDGHTRGICELSSDRVQFLHRSARDWARGEKMWAEILAKTPAGFRPGLEMLESFLMQARTDQALWADIGEATVINTARPLLRYAFDASSSGAAGDARLVEALDNANRLLCDLDAASEKTGQTHTVIRPRTVSSKDPNPEGFSSNNWLSLQMTEDPAQFEHSFVGVAARAGLVGYVRAKVLADKSLLAPKTGRMSLLENAIFPRLESLKCKLDIYYSFVPENTSDQRLEIIRFLLNSSDTCYTTAVGDPMYDIVCAARDNNWEPFRGDPRFPYSSNWNTVPVSGEKTDENTGEVEWYNEVLQLLKEHGYCPGGPGGSENGVRKKPETAQKKIGEGSHESSKQDKTSRKVKGRRRFGLKRWLNKLRGR